MEMYVNLTEYYTCCKCKNENNNDLDFEKQRDSSLHLQVLLKCRVPICLKIKQDVYFDEKNSPKKTKKYIRNVKNINFTSPECVSMSCCDTFKTKMKVQSKLIL